MNKRNMVLAFIALIVTTLVGCAHQYALKENWVDDDDLVAVVSDPQISSWAKRFGTPVFTEIRQDTVEFIYNYKPHLYKSRDNGRMFKPNDKDRLDLWNDRTEYVGFVVYQDRIIQVRPRPDYAETQQVDSATPFPYWIFIALAAVGGIVTLIVLTD